MSRYWDGQSSSMEIAERRGDFEREELYEPDEGRYWNPQVETLQDYLKRVGYTVQAKEDA